MKKHTGENQMQEIKGKYTSAKVFINKEDKSIVEQVQAVCDHPIFEDCNIPLSFL